MNKISGGISGLALLLVIIGAVNLILSNLPFRMDLTAEKLYTLSNGSKEVLGKLEQDVTLKFYFSSSSREMPMGLKTYATQVEDLLKEYQLAGKGHLLQWAGGLRCPDFWDCTRRSPDRSPERR